MQYQERMNENEGEFMENEENVRKKKKWMNNIMEK